LRRAADHRAGDLCLTTQTGPARRRGASLMVLLGVLLMSCSVADTAPLEDLATRPTGASSSTSLPAEPTTTATVSITDPAGHAGLYQVDPRTLEPVDASAPITTGDWLHGTSSTNGAWLALTVWLDDDPDTDLIRVVNVADQKVVTEANVLVPTYPMVADDGTAYWVNGHLAPFIRLHSLQAGEGSAELAFNAFPVGFERLTGGTILDVNRIGWLGLFGPQTEEDAPGLVVLDLATSSTTTYLLPGITVGGGEVDLGESSIFEWFQPEVVWDAERDMAYAVHADQDAFTVVDLDTGESKTLSWATSASWWGGLLTWLIPPAQAKGPSLDTRRSLALSPDGATLFVGTHSGELLSEPGDDLSVLGSPRGVTALSTETGEKLQHWDIPVSEVYLSPTGEYLVATGLTIEDNLSTSNETPEGSFIINVATGELVGHFMTRNGYLGQFGVQFSRDGDLVYLTAYGGRIDVVELESGEVVSSVTGPEYLTIFGESGLLATSRR
jgi:hypothetical protein